MYLIFKGVNGLLVDLMMFLCYDTTKLHYKSDN